MNSMEITCLDSTMSSQIEALQRELAELNSSEKILLEEIRQEEARLPLAKKRCDDLFTEIALKKASLAESKKELEEMDSSISYIIKQEEQLKSQMGEMEEKLERLKGEREAEIAQLSQTVEELERGQPQEDSTLDPEMVQLMEEEDKLKEEFLEVCKKIEGNEIVLAELHNKTCSAQERVAQVQLQSSQLKHLLKERQQALQDTYTEKARLESLLNQPHKDLNNQKSLFNEVVDEVSVIAKDYEKLKKKYLKSKEILTANNAEISRLKAEDLKYKRFDERMKTELTQLAKEMKSRLVNRKQDLLYEIEFLKQKAEQSKKIKPTVINIFNISEVNRLAKNAHEEVKRVEEELVGSSMNRIQMEKRLFQVDRDLAIAKQQLKEKRELNQQLEQQVQTFKEKEPTSGPATEPTKQLRFADEIKDI